MPDVILKKENIKSNHKRWKIINRLPSIRFLPHSDYRFVSPVVTPTRTHCLPSKKCVDQLLDNRHLYIYVIKLYKIFIYIYIDKIHRHSLRTLTTQWWLYACVSQQQNGIKLKSNDIKFTQEMKIQPKIKHQIQRWRHWDRIQTTR